MYELINICGTILINLYKIDTIKHVKLDLMIKFLFQQNTCVFSVYLF